MRNITFDNADMLKVISRLEGMTNKMLPPTEVRKIKVRASKPMEYAIKSLINRSGRTRRRGNAIYVSGNLQNSPKVLPLRKRQLVYLGIQVVKNASGTYGTSRGRVNAWYGHFVEYGTKPYKGRRGITAQMYFHKGVRASEAQSLQVMQNEIQKRFNSLRW